MQVGYLEVKHYNKAEIAGMIAQARSSYLNCNECEVTDAYVIDNFVNYLYARILAPEATVADE